MSADWLREIRAAATPGPWDYNLPAGLRVINRNDARLIALAPDLAELCADMFDDLAVLTAELGVGALMDIQLSANVRAYRARITALKAAHSGEDSKATEGSK